MNFEYNIHLIKLNIYYNIIYKIFILNIINKKFI